ncbi:hypothetical protein GRF59_01260 [Paenibacillus sp. HJL G12]|uniref:DUF4430 domain-containing protein n=1 Tax=Paenibacillus dendrobii TaxID=2691084 RepID=A0A7X3LFJ5_9BACL|nr:hypothetical protein [Paenibacillus dendrobii]MWV42245.1 hypothetical protein [Paenibacillus dendrobii]
MVLRIKKTARIGKTLFVATIMLVSVAGSAFAEEFYPDRVFVNGQEMILDRSIHLTPIFNVSPPTSIAILTDQNTSNAGKVVDQNAKEHLTAYLTYRMGDTIPGTYTWPEERYGGTLTMTNIVQEGSEISVTYEGWVDKNLN